MNSLADTAVANGSDPFYLVVIEDGEQQKVWRNWHNLAEAEREVAMLRRNGFDARIITVGKTE